MKDRAMKNKKLYYMCFCAALVGSLQTVYGQTEDEVGQLAAVSEDSSQVSYPFPS